MSDETPKASRSSIQDNYPEYIEQVYGYAYEVDDVMPQEALARQERLLSSDAEALEALELDQFDDFERWTVAHAWRKLGNTDRFIELGRQVLESDQQHPVIIYPEISRGLAWELTSQARFDEARELLEAHLERWSGDLEGRQLSAIVELIANDDPNELRDVASDYPSDPEIRFEIAEDLWHLGRAEAAVEWLEKARTVAYQAGDRAALVDIELLAERINGAPSRPDADA